jgi:hypothetical protein
MFMSANEIREAAPAIYAERGASFLSSEYGFMPTYRAIEIMQEHGFGVVQAKQDLPRRRNPEWVRHAVVMRHEDLGAVGEVAPQILLINSHNGRTKMSLRAGLYRFVCANGMVVGDDQMKTAVRHTLPLAAQILDHINRSVVNLQHTFQSMERWSSIELSESKRNDLANAAIALRFGPQRVGAYKAADVLEAHRTEDEGYTLWKVFNRVQENTTMRALPSVSALGRTSKSRPLTGIGENTAYNEALWNLAETFAA